MCMDCSGVRSVASAQQKPSLLPAQPSAQQHEVCEICPCGKAKQHKNITNKGLHCGFCDEHIPFNTEARSCIPCDWNMGMDCSTKQLEVQPSAQQDLEQFKEGDHVEANYDGEGTWYAATFIGKADKEGYYDVLYQVYDNAKFMAPTKLEDIRRPLPQQHQMP